MGDIQIQISNDKTEFSIDTNNYINITSPIVAKNNTITVNDKKKHTIKSICADTTNSNIYFTYWFYPVNTTLPTTSEPSGIVYLQIPYVVDANAYNNPFTEFVNDAKIVQNSEGGYTKNPNLPKYNIAELIKSLPQSQLRIYKDTAGEDATSATKFTIKYNTIYLRNEPPLKATAAPSDIQTGNTYTPTVTIANSDTTSSKCIMEVSNNNLNLDSIRKNNTPGSNRLNPINTNTAEAITKLETYQWLLITAIVLSFTLFTLYIVTTFIPDILTVRRRRMMGGSSGLFKRIFGWCK
jgi:hypothetical protein